MGKPEAWKARVLGASAEATRNAAMAEVDLDWPAAGKDEEGTPLGPWHLEKASVTRMPLAGPSPDDYRVDLRFATGMSQAVRSAALIKQADGTYCALKGPSDEQSFDDHSCLAGDEPWPIAFQLVHLVDKERYTIASMPSSGRCAGCGRSARHDIVFFEARGFELEPIFRQETFAAEYSGCPRSPDSWRQASVEWTGAYPRDIVVVAETRCADRDPSRPGGDEPCTPSADETRYQLRDGAYVAGDSRAVTAPYLAAVSLSEGGFDDGTGRAWAGRCYRRLQDGKLDDAEVDCQRAIARGTDKEIRASAFFNLARIAEKRGDVKAACGHLASSLAVRPDNSTTKAKRDELCKPK